MTYAIKGWDETFENNKSRAIVSPSYVAWPVRRDSEAFQHLSRMTNFLEAFGLFALLVQLAARQNPRGVLKDDRGDITPERLAKRYGKPVKTLKEAWESLANADVGWLFELEGTQEAPSARPPAPSALTETLCVALSSTPSLPSPPSNPTPTESLFDPAAGFVDFWKLYPSNGRKGDKKDCLRVWTKEKLGLRHAEVVKALKKFIKCPQWKDQDGKFIPAPLVFLNRALYDDPPATVLHPLARRITAEEFRKLDASFGVGPAIEKPTGVPIPQTHTETPPDIGTQQGGSNAK